jgi:hypothetical protein
LPIWNNGQLIRMFSDEYRNKNKTNDWYGEHAGKWLYSTADSSITVADNPYRVP